VSGIPAWVWAGGGLVGAGLIFFILSRFFGWKIGGIAAAAFLALGAFKASMARARAEGAAKAEAEQRQKNIDLERRIAEAREAERRRQQETGHAIDENDPNLRDP
jgi:Sec-independent protein translocase protein TatA